MQKLDKITNSLTFIDVAVERDELGKAVLKCFVHRNDQAFVFSVRAIRKFVAIAIVATQVFTLKCRQMYVSNYFQRVLAVVDKFVVIKAMPFSRQRKLFARFHQQIVVILLKSIKLLNMTEFCGIKKNQKK